MRRSFAPDPVAPEVIESLVDLARRAPSAGNTQGWDLVVLEGAETARFWDITLPAPRREGFKWPGLVRAPLIVLPVASRTAYVARYGESDKAASGLGAGASAWPVPYWQIDTAFFTMTLLLAAEAAGLGALFFGVFKEAEAVAAELGIPDGHDIIGAIALGWPATEPERPGRSAARPKRPATEIIHRGGW